MASTVYTYDTSGRLIREKYNETYNDFSSNSRDILYLYDESGIVGAVQTYNTTTETFYFDRNIKGDVIGIYNASGTQIAKYSYDSWGNSKLATLSSNNFSAYNPIRYRGYYFDAESGLYFLNARYYNPACRRFISPDDTAYLDPDTPNGLNLYAYCNNDPVNYADPSGNSVIAALLIGAAIGGALGGLTAYFENQDILTGILTGALLGASVGAIIGIGGAVLSGAISSVIGKATTDFFSVAFFGGEFGDWEDYAIAFAFGGITGHLGQFTNNLAKGSKFAFDVFGRPAVNQVVKFVLRGVPLNIDKYLYDVAIRSVTYGEFGYITQFEFCGQNAKIDVLKCLIRATAKFIRPYTLKPRTMLPRLVYA
jgi:RHS repeat-associated protein